MLYNVLIEEQLAGNFVIEADSKEKALEIARAKYKNAEFIVPNANLMETKIYILEPNEEWSETAFGEEV